MIEHKCERFAVHFAQLDNNIDLLDVEGRWPRGDDDEVCSRDAWLDQLKLGRWRIDEDPLPALAHQQLDGLAGSVDFEQLRVFLFAASVPPRAQALLWIEIEKRDALAFFGRSNREPDCNGSFANPTFCAR